MDNDTVVDNDTAMDNESESLVPRGPKNKPIVGQSTFMALIATFVLAVVALSLSICLGWRISRVRSHSYASAVQDGSHLAVLPEMVSSSVVPVGELVNSTGLDLKTGFLVSGKPSVREFEFTISHAYASPDGVRKPMILINGQSPGPLIEANSGDTIRVYMAPLTIHLQKRLTGDFWH